jgi:hemerythrin-like domain-containing protein
MPAPTLTEILEFEHRTILKVVGAAAVLVARIEAGEAIEPPILEDVVAFMRTYADRYHHAKEEAQLYPCLVQRGVPTTGCPIGALMGEHKEARALVTALSDAVAPYAAGDPTARETALTSLKGIATLYPNHIWKEDYLLFPMTNKVLSQEDQQELLERFAQVDEAMGAGAREHFERLAAELTQ